MKKFFFVYPNTTQPKLTKKNYTATLRKIVLISSVTLSLLKTLNRLTRENFCKCVKIQFWLVSHTYTTHNHIDITAGREPRGILAPPILIQNPKNIIDQLLLTISFFFWFIIYASFVLNSIECLKGAMFLCLSWSQFC